MRAATASGVSAFGSAPRSLVTSCTRSTMPKIGMMNDAATTAISCCGVLMNEECGSCVSTIGLVGWEGVILGEKLAILRLPRAPVAQRIRVLASEAKGRGFESRRARQLPRVPLARFPGPLVSEEFAERTERAVDAGFVHIQERDEAHTRARQHQDIALLEMLGECRGLRRRHGGEHHVGVALHRQIERLQAF